MLINYISALGKRDGEENKQKDSVKSPCFRSGHFKSVLETESAASSTQKRLVKHWLRTALQRVLCDHVGMNSESRTTHEVKGRVSPPKEYHKHIHFHGCFCGSVGSTIIKRRAKRQPVLYPVVQKRSMKVAGRAKVPFLCSLA